jgi:hypothetical protein
MQGEHFEPRLGRIRAPGSRRARSYLHSVLALATRAGGFKRAAGRRFVGARVGRGGVAARSLGERDRHSGLRARRAIVKTRLVRLGANGIAAARAHLRYIQRDGVARDGEAGRLYSAAADRADGCAFVERCSGDRHQFRLIVSAEDGSEYEDLRPLIRRFMARIEDDLGTKLDWVAADHVDTLHPHTHIMIFRGKDELGENLVIAPDYIKHPGMESVENKRKTVQHPDGGIIRLIHVHEGSTVKSGQPLITLDDTNARVNVSVFQSQSDSLRAERATLEAQLLGRSEIDFPADLLQRESDPLVAGILRTQRAAFAARRDVVNGRPGVPATVLIKTGRRTLIAYLFQPILRARFNAIREH